MGGSKIALIAGAGIGGTQASIDRWLSEVGSVKIASIAFHSQGTALCVGVVYEETGGVSGAEYGDEQPKQEVPEGEYVAPTCTECGADMVMRFRRKDGKPFWGCTGYPSCRKIVNFDKERDRKVDVRQNGSSRFEEDDRDDIPF